MHIVHQTRAAGSAKIVARFSLMLFLAASLTGCTITETGGAQATSGHVILDRSEMVYGQVPPIRFIAPSGPWSIGWETGCATSAPAYAHTLAIVAVSNEGSEPAQWYATHPQWSQTLASGTGTAATGSAIVTDHRGQTFLEIYAFCPWRIVVETGTGAKPLHP
jgi:hypothetical protein